MGLVQDEQAAGEHGAEPGSHGLGIDWVNQQVVGHQKPAVGQPRVDAETAFTAHSGDVGPVDDLEHQPEPLLQLTLPLL